MSRCTCGHAGPGGAYRPVGVCLHELLGAGHGNLAYTHTLPGDEHGHSEERKENGSLSKEGSAK